MKQYLTFFLLAATVLLLSACMSKSWTPTAETTPVIKKLLPDKAKELFGNNSSYVLIDVREPYEYAEGHIPNAVNIPLSGIVKGVNDLGLDKESSAIVVYCRSGRRSAEAATALSNAGYKNLYDPGGIIDWPYEIEK